MADALKPFVVKRSLWYRGKGGEQSKLLREDDGLMCCLGQWAIFAVGLPSDVVNEQSSFEACDGETKDREELQRLLAFDEDVEEQVDSSLAHQIIETNDSEWMGDAQREAELVRLFASLGYAVTFED